jgi:hypothetical protein
MKKLIVNCTTKEVETVDMTAEEITINQAEIEAEMNRVIFEPIDEEKNALIEAIMDLDTRLSSLEGGI